MVWQGWVEDVAANGGGGVGSAWMAMNGGGGERGAWVAMNGGGFVWSAWVAAQPAPPSTEMRRRPALSIRTTGTLPRARYTGLA